MKKAMKAMVSAMRSVEQFGYVRARNEATGLDEFMWVFVEKVFLPRFRLWDGNWQAMFESKDDARAFLADLRNCGELCLETIACFSSMGCHALDPESFNEAIADDLEESAEGAFGP